MAIMHSHIPAKRFCVSALSALLFVSLHTASAQSNSSALEQLLKSSKANPSLANQLSPTISDSLQQLLRERQSNQQIVDTSAVDSSRSDTLVQPPQRSIYQKLFAGQTIHPDSLMSTLDIFGHDIFSRNANAPANNEAQNVPASYAIGPGDELIVSLWGRINEEHRLSVDRNGAIQLP
jgi:hypothetical protein